MKIPKRSRIDTAMLEAADKIHKNLTDGVCKNLYANQINGNDCINLIARLEDKGFIRVIKHPNRRGNAYEWQHGQLRPYQVHMLNLIQKSKDSFLIAAMPTGSGKTRLALALIQQYDKTLFVTPRINLSAQTHSVFGESLDVGLMQGNNTKNLNAPHIIANLQTLERRLDDLPEFDIVLFDEVHYSFERIQKLIPGLNTKRVIGLTATAYYADGTPLPAKTIEPFDIRYFIDKGYLAPLKCMQAVLVDDTRLKKSVNGDFTQKSVDDVTSDDIFNQSIIEATKDEIKGQTIVFAANINHCEKLATGYREAGFEVLVMHSRDDDALESLQAFRDNKAQILATVSMVSFGTDLPSVETGIVARPIGSKSLWRQIVGRLLRTAPGKTQALLLDCGGNLKRLGNPLSPARPPEERDHKAKPECKECGYKKAPYLKSFSQDFNQITRLYRCASCGDEFEKTAEIDTVACEKCNRYYLTTDCIIKTDKEVLACACGHETVINTLDDLALILSDDDLLQHKLKSAIKDADDETDLMEIVGASQAILKAVNDGMYSRETILLMLEAKGLLGTAAVIKHKSLADEIAATKAHDKQLKARLEKQLQSKVDKQVQSKVDKQLNKIKQQAIKQAKQQLKQESLDNQSATNQPKRGMQVLLESVSSRYREKGKDGLSSKEITRLMQDYDDCTLPQKEMALKTRLQGIEDKGQPLGYIMGFIEYIEQHQQPSY